MGSHLPIGVYVARHVLAHEQKTRVLRGEIFFRVSFTYFMTQGHRTGDCPTLSGIPFLISNTKNEKAPAIALISMTLNLFQTHQLLEET